MNALLDAVNPSAFAATIDGKAYDEEASRNHALEHCNRKFSALRADRRVEWALENLPGNHVLTSSFGAQAAVSLHLVSSIEPGIPVILVDTGYLFPETYRFVDELAGTLKINLKVYRAERSPAWQESRYGQRWNQGLEGIEAYNQENKVEPMRRALRDLGANTWFAGLRRKQSETRSSATVSRMGGRPLEGSSDRGLDRPRRASVSHEAQFAVSPAMGERLLVDRRSPQHAADSRSQHTRPNSLLRPHARVRHSRDRSRRPLGSGSEIGA